MNSDQNRRTPPQHLVTFVEIFFAVVLGSSVLEYSASLFTFPDNLGDLSFYALLSVYITAAASWAGWHSSTYRYPYTPSKAGYLRSVFDALIVVNYAFLLFWGKTVDKSFVLSEKDWSLGWYLWGFVAVFFLYYLSGKVRIVEYGQRASRLGLIERHGALVLIGALSYTVLAYYLPENPDSALRLFVFVPTIVMLSYRWQREWKGLPWTTKSTGRTTVAVDLDGVLVEQVIPVLEKLKGESNVELCKSMITDWEYPIGETNIKIEIEKAEREEEFIQKMPSIEDAVKGMDVLSNRFRVVIATSREPITDNWSRNWLKDHSITHEEFINTRSSGKTLEGVSILIDDYIGNIDRFVRSGNQNRQAILFAQPWNQDVKKIADLLEGGKVKIAHSWLAVLALLGCSESEVDVSKDKDDSRVKYDSEAVSKDYFILQAISCFTASLLFLRGYVVSSNGASILDTIARWTGIPLSLIFLVLSFFFLLTAYIRRLFIFGESVGRLLLVSSSIISLAEITLTWLGGITTLRPASMLFKGFFWAGYLFFLCFAAHLVWSSFHYGGTTRQKSNR